MEKTNKGFCLLLLVFGVFSLLQFLSGFWIYLKKLDFDPRNTLVYYQGSKVYSSDEVSESSKVYQPRSFRGLLKTAVSHATAYAILCFTLAHFLRSLTGGSKMAEYLSHLLIFFGGLDILSTFIARYGPPWIAFGRFAVLVLFVLTGICSGILLFSLSISRMKGNHLRS